MNAKLRRTISGAVNRALHGMLASKRRAGPPSDDLEEVECPEGENDPYSLAAVTRADLFRELVSQRYELDRLTRKCEQHLLDRQLALGRAAILRHENNKLRIKPAPRPRVRLRYPSHVYVAGKMDGKGTVDVLHVDGSLSTLMNRVRDDESLAEVDTVVRQCGADERVVIFRRADGQWRTPDMLARAHPGLLASLGVQLP